MLLKRSPLLIFAALMFMTGCGGSSGGSQSSTSSAATSSSATGGQEAAGALGADARSAATGDIPDTQNFLTLTAPRVRISMLHPEGWTVQDAASTASISDKNNLVRITLSRAAAPTVASVQAQMAALMQSAPSLTVGTPHPLTLKSGPAVKVTYSTQSAPNPVTGKQVTLTVDRYVLAHAGRVAVVDLETPVGVDNVHAYRRMIESFKWQ